MARYLFVLALLVPAPAFAHKLNLFAQARGATIEGRAYFTGNIAARGIDVIACDPSGGELGRAKTGDDGSFSLAARVNVDYHLSAETPDGHAATYVVAAAELPDSLPAAYTAAAASPVASAHPASDTAAGAKPDAVADPPGIEAMEKQIAALRTQINQSEQRLQFRDLLGGIGYILGLAGIWMLVKAKSKKNESGGAQ